MELSYEKLNEKSCTNELHERVARKIARTKKNREKKVLKEKQMNFGEKSF